MFLVRAHGQVAAVEDFWGLIYRVVEELVYFCKKPSWIQHYKQGHTEGSGMVFTKKVDLMSSKQDIENVSFVFKYLLINWIRYFQSDTGENALVGTEGQFHGKMIKGYQLLVFH